MTKFPAEPPPPTRPVPRGLRALLAGTAVAVLAALFVLASPLTHASGSEPEAATAATPPAGPLSGAHERGMGPWPYAPRG